MLKRIALLLAAVPLIAGWYHGGGGTGPVVGTVCDQITGGCAEAWSVTHQLVTGYSGNLLQIALFSSPSTVMEIPQKTDGSGMADMTGVATFCGSAISNCAISKIYAQHYGHSNDLLPSIFLAQGNHPDCRAGGLTCATPLVIEAATGLPVLNTNTPLPSAPSDNPEYALAGDNAAIGYNSGKATRSVFAVWQDNAKNTCCGFFGAAHKYSSPDLAGTDFMMIQSYGNGGSFANCANSTAYCFGADLEQAGKPTPGLTQAPGYCVTSGHPANLIAFMTYDAPSDYLSMTLNGVQIMYGTTGPNMAMTIDGSIHLGGGGDLSQPAVATVRDMALTNTAISAADQAKVQAAVAAFYTALAFPTVSPTVTC